jgi:hypothetical protein
MSSPEKPERCFSSRDQPHVSPEAKDLYYFSGRSNHGYSSVNYKSNTVECFEFYEETLYPLEWVTCAVDAAMAIAASNAELDRIQVERLAELRPSINR